MKNQFRNVVTKLSQGWRHHGGNLYYFSKEKSSWEEAECFCVSQNLHLSAVLSQEEQEYLAMQLRGADHWIGLSDHEAVGSWRWVDGSKYTEGFWTESQADNWDQGVGGTEDYVHLDHIMKDGTMPTAPCSTGGSVRRPWGRPLFSQGSHTR
ncbi:C-type lectin domain family 4 member F-like [Alligator mississippiensis]|uniref:C-type lectin domain family 4 member F-like n=1 Tax=Alligator mississippiensis TaxID=8496 RepID=UPI0028777CBA|nr:C-type lectin domain family 4 member F-like [Alligator mississippiensis]